MSRSKDSGSDANNEHSAAPGSRHQANNLKNLYSYLSPEDKDAFLFGNSHVAKNLLEKAKRARTQKRVRAQGPVSQASTSRFIGPLIPSHITRAKHQRYREEVRAARERRERHLAAEAAMAEQLSRLKSLSKTPVKTRTKSRAEVLEEIAQERSQKEASTRKAARLASLSRARARLAEARKNPETRRHFKRGFQAFEPGPAARGDTDKELAKRYARRFGIKEGLGK